MRTSVNWINDHLDPSANADEQAELLTRAGFPFDGREAVDGDIQQEIETTSNRGDCLCHVGLAREIAAISSRTLRDHLPGPTATGPEVTELVTVRNERPDLCPLYTARVILGARVGPSPKWLADRLRTIGQIPRNNIVDATNFVLFELGQPTHVFDLGLLTDRTIVVRMARPAEPFLPIGEGASPVNLSDDDLVIADSTRAVAIAGVKGGAETAVREATTDLVLEAATFMPVAVRRTSQRLRIASDSSYRFERGVHPAQVDAAAERLAALILETAGGTLCAGVARAGAELPEPRRIALRADRCRALLGVAIDTARMIDGLERLGLAPTRDGETLHCTVPAHRLDLQREIDLIEEVARMHGLDALPIAETIAVRVAPPQQGVEGRRALRDALAGMGLVETVTHSLVSESAASPFVPPSTTALRVADDRARAEPILRPSVIPSLLRVRAHNDDVGNRPLSLFEIAAIFRMDGDHHAEEESLGILVDLDDPTTLRELRGIVERTVAVAFGVGVDVAVAESSTPCPWLDPVGALVVKGAQIGRFGRVAAPALRAVGLDRPVAAAELKVAALLAAYPPETIAHDMPAFPAIDRDLSVVVSEGTAWNDIDSTLSTLCLPALERIAFVGLFRAAALGTGRKSVTIRLRFRASDRTLRHDEIDEPIERAVTALRDGLGAELRS